VVTWHSVEFGKCKGLGLFALLYGYIVHADTYDNYCSYSLLSSLPLPLMKECNYCEADFNMDLAG
jgi:hypothetical protein